MSATFFLNMQDFPLPPGNNITLDDFAKLAKDRGFLFEHPKTSWCPQPISKPIAVLAFSTDPMSAEVHDIGKHQEGVLTTETEVLGPKTTGRPLPPKESMDLSGGIMVSVSETMDPRTKKGEMHTTDISISNRFAALQEEETPKKRKISGHQGTQKRPRIQVGVEQKRSVKIRPTMESERRKSTGQSLYR